ncbi:MAG: polysaccharide biosynthesis/export family protein [Bacteroidales bacterium]|nr:polysaccharide biosynthesis/export family protein [Bacteroidales bacterium]
MKRFFIGCSIVAMSLTACRTTKDITYFQSAEPTLDQIALSLGETYTPRIQPGDVLSIVVSSLNKEANEMFNPIPLNNNVQQRQVGVLQPANGFRVDSTGYISLPLLGSLKAQGLTTNEFSARITEGLDAYLEAPTVVVRLANFQISVMGEVGRPSVYNIPNEKITLPEAIALAGDIGIYGRKTNVLIIREEGDHRTFARIDMTGRDFFFSPYYYLHPGDIVYVEATSGKITASDRIYQLAPIFLSSISVILVLINILK